MYKSQLLGQLNIRTLQHTDETRTRGSYKEDRTGELDPQALKLFAELEGKVGSHKQSKDRQDFRAGP